MNHDRLRLEKTSLGIELGSTRIKAILINEDLQTIAQGEYSWKSTLEKGLWTYKLEDVWLGVQAAYKELATEVEEEFGIPLTQIGSVGISAMMHGYLALNNDGKLLTSFRTWENTSTTKAAYKLSSKFEFNIPHRWSIAHLYQAILDEEDHVASIDFLTTLAGYTHWKLTGQKIVGVGDASGMFPINSAGDDYDQRMIDLFQEILEKNNLSFSLRDIFPIVKKAGDYSGFLTEEGARLLDPSGRLKAGIPFCAPEGDAGTGMVATNSIKEYQGNISAGTSIFSMIVLKEKLSNYYKEIDIVNTPTGKPVAMVHCNNFTSDINEWVDLFKELTDSLESDVNKGDLFELLFKKAMEADQDTGNLYNCNYISGEPITGFDNGRPLFVRMPNSKFTLSNFMKSQIYSALATLKIGMDLLIKNEKVKVNKLLGHGGFFKTEKVGQQMMADALNIPITVMDTAGEGGAWGVSILASFILNKKSDQSLEDYLDNQVFKDNESLIADPKSEGVESFKQYLSGYLKVLEVERLAINVLK